MTPRETVEAVQSVADRGGYSDVAISWVAVGEGDTLTRVDSQPELGFMVVDNYYCSVVFTINNGVITPVYANGMVR